MGIPNELQNEHWRRKNSEHVDAVIINTGLGIAVLDNVSDNNYKENVTKFQKLYSRATNGSPRRCIKWHVYSKCCETSQNTIYFSLLQS
ncbi:hypothetical protein GE061_007654 [Apolygus lucorum]|uniref:Uncharacterized protein n=1 Tax=Apolygus lucorum TaxID=248454 RepID=A0A6A4J2J8_APOLU|nr:hypothetical protein GE061_007654 [Apolygus lucorum]